MHDLNHLSDLLIVQPKTPEEVDALEDDIRTAYQWMPNYEEGSEKSIREFPEYLTMIYCQGQPVVFIQIEDNRGFDVGKDSLEFSGGVHPDYRGYGLTFAIAPMVIRQAFKRTGKRKMLAKIDPENREAQAAIAALGFERVKPHPDAPPMDKYIYKLTRKKALNKENNE